MAAPAALGPGPAASIWLQLSRTPCSSGSSGTMAALGRKTTPILASRTLECYLDKPHKYSEADYRSVYEEEKQEAALHVSRAAWGCSPYAILLIPAGRHSDGGPAFFACAELVPDVWGGRHAEGAAAPPGAAKVQACPGRRAQGLQLR